MSTNQSPSPVSPRYRAILHDPLDTTAERPVVIYANSWLEIESWAENVLKQAHSPHAVVTAFETLEQFVKIFTPPREEKKP